jgi:rhodanese-related sulfurtransferase
MSTASTITVEQLADSCRQSPLELIDVRTPVEFREAHLKMARNVPLDSLDPQAVMTGRAEQDQPLYVICNAGGRGATACQKFQQAGFTNVVNVEGGTQAWIDAGLPVVRGQKAISLERQVRIAAGFLVLLGAVLGYFLNINFIGLSAFVGAGLMFAGITDTCGMAMVLTKMPWNQVSNAACSSP